MSNQIVPLSSGAAYATKGNIAFPGTQAQATAEETLAQTRINDALPSLVQVTVSAGAIKIGA